MSKHQLERINNLIVTEFAKTVELFGLNPSEARLFTILYIENKPMTLNEMGEAIGKSKTSVSTGIRTLSDLNLVERVWKKGERKDLYQADENLYKKFMSAYINKWLDATNRQKQSLKEIETILEKENCKTNEKSTVTPADELNERLKEMIHFHQLIEKAFKDIRTEPQR
jgi:DNA-binding transcriptional regulator GbsR (MarR family)